MAPLPRLLIALALALPVSWGGAEVPAAQAAGMLEASPEPSLSPLWGMVALQSGILRNIRFNGPYGSTPDPRFPRHPSLPEARNCPLDAVSAVVQDPFPSPDGENFVHNERTKDPVGEIAQELKKGRKGAAGLRKVALLVQAVAGYRKAVAALPAGDPALEPLALECRTNLTRILDRAKAPAKAESAFGALQTQFAGLLQAAALEETRDARGLYPPDVVEVALLAYAWRAADQGADLEAAFGGVLLGKPAPGRIAFDERYYRANLERFRKGIRQASAEEVALFLHGALAYGNPLPPLASYRTTEYQGAAYPDCGETALRNFFTIAFSRDGALDPRRIEAFAARFSTGETKGEDKGGHGRLKELGAFFTEPGCLENQGSAAAHLAWSHLVSGLNAPKDPLPITYRGGNHNLQGVGLANMLNLIAHLLPDPVLNEPWPTTDVLRHEMAARKLTRLCERVSQEDRKVEWRAGGGTVVNGDYLDVDFRIQGERAFTWKFLPGHFVLQAREASAIDWLKDIGPRPGSPWLEAWVFKQRQLQSPGLLEPFRPYSFYCGSASEVTGALRLAYFYLRPDEPALRPGIFNLLDRTLVDDEFSFSQAARLLADHPAVRSDPRYYPMSRLRAMAQATKDRALLEALLIGVPEAFQVCLDHGADPNLPFQGQPCLYLALLVRSNDPAIALALIRAGADARIPGFLHQAVRGGVKPEVLRAMVEAGADPRAPDQDGATPLDLARDRKDEAVLAALEAAPKAAPVPPQ